MSGAAPGTGQPDRRPRKDVLRNREHLLRVADELVAEQGLKISLNELAHRAGVGVGTVYRHFPDVKAVVDAQLDQRVETLCQSIEAIGPLEDSIEELRQVLVSIGELQAADRALFQVIAQAMTPDQYERIHGRLRPLIRRVVERGKATGRLRADFASSDIPMIMHMLRAVSEYTQEIRPDLWRRYLEVIIDGFLDVPDAHLTTAPLTPRQGERIVAARAEA